MTGMRMGFGLPVSGAWATPSNIREIAGEAERLGYSTLWSFQRLFAGASHTVPEASVLPKPVQPDGPPILLGGTAPRALARAGAMADGWISNSRADPETLGDSVEAVRAGAREAGRDPSALEFVCRG